MENEGSSPCSQQHDTCLYPEPDEASPFPNNFHFLKIHFSIILYQISPHFPSLRSYHNISPGPKAHQSVS